MYSNSYSTQVVWAGSISGIKSTCKSCSEGPNSIELEGRQPLNKNPWTDGRMRCFRNDKPQFVSATWKIPQISMRWNIKSCELLTTALVEEKHVYRVYVNIPCMSLLVAQIHQPLTYQHLGSTNFEGCWISIINIVLRYINYIYIHV